MPDVWYFHPKRRIQHPLTIRGDFFSEDRGRYNLDRREQGKNRVQGPAEAVNSSMYGGNYMYHLF